MDFQAFLNGLIAGSADEVAATAITVALLVFGLIELVDTYKHLPSDFKFWSALVLSFVVPLGAYSLGQYITAQRIELNGLFLACSVGYAASQILHKGKDVIADLIARRKGQERVQERLDAFVGKVPQGDDPGTRIRIDRGPTDLTNSGDAMPYPDGERGPSGGL